MTVSRTPEQDDYLAAVHEAGHAVFAVGQAWVQLADDVEIAERGAGTAPVRLSDDVGTALRSDPDFDPDDARRDLIQTFLAGAAAERRGALEKGIPLAEEDTRWAARHDYAAARAQLEKLGFPTAPLEQLLEELELEVREAVEHPFYWCLVKSFAADLLARRCIPAIEATALIEGYAEECRRLIEDLPPAD